MKINYYNIIIFNLNFLMNSNFLESYSTIKDNNEIISSNIKQLQEYYFKIGSNKDNKHLIEKA
jgi:hypothetical protein